MSKMGAKCPDYGDSWAQLNAGLIAGPGRWIVGIVTRAGRYKWPLYIGRNCRHIAGIVCAIL